MTLRRLATTALLLLPISVVLSAQSPKAEIQPHFQVVSAQILQQNLGADDSTIPAVFLLDNVSGKIWKYQEVRTMKFADGKNKIQPDMFFPVELGGPVAK